MIVIIDRNDDFVLVEREPGYAQPYYTAYRGETGPMTHVKYFYTLKDAQRDLDART